MEKYKLKLKKSAQKELASLPKKDLKLVLKAIEELAENPRGLNSKKLSGDEKYRRRVGKYRVLYEIHDDILIIFVVKVAHRKDVYQKK